MKKKIKKAKQEYDRNMPKVQSCKLSYDQHWHLNIDPEIKTNG